MNDADKLAQLLYETVQVLEAHNFMELLPSDALAWYENRKSSEIDAEEQGKTEALRFLQRKVEHWQRIEKAE